MEKNYKYFSAISVFFVSILLISNIASTKIVDFGWFIFDGGTILFPLAYIFGDILTEIYGYKKSKEVIWLGFSMAFLMALIFIIVGALPPAADWNNQEAYNLILGLTPRLVFASLTAYLFGAFSNSYVLAKMKVWTDGRMLWARTIGSTLVGQLLDSTIFILVAFLGVLPGEVLFALIISNYLFKSAVEILFTPVTYRVVSFLKKEEGIDHFDKGTKFSPF